MWLFEAKKRLGTSILNYTVTSNHVHLIIRDVKGEEVIPPDHAIDCKQDRNIIREKIAGVLFGKIVIMLPPWRWIPI
jgi:hypothetical protein